MFKNMKIGKKIVIGFSSVLILLTLIGVLSYNALTDASSGLARYRTIARNANMVGLIQANMLMVRMNVRDYLGSGSDQDIQQYEDYYKKTNDFVAQGQELIKNKERSKTIAEAKQRLSEYNDGFIQVTQFMAKQKDRVNNVLNVKGPLMERNLTKIMDLAKGDNDVTAAFHSGLSQRNLLLARLYMAKFLETNDQSAVDRVHKEFSEMQTDLDIMEKEINNPERQRLLAEVMRAKNEYVTVFDEVARIILDRNKVVTSTLDRIGPEVAQKTDDIKLAYKTEQDSLGPQLVAANKSRLNFIIITAVVAIIFGLSIALLLTRNITKSIVKMVAILKELSLGHLSVQVNMDTNDEIGQMAQTVDVFIAGLQSEVLGNLKKIAAGDLTFEAKINDKDDEIGNTLRQVGVDLNEVMGQIGPAAEQIASGSGQVSSASQSLSQGATEQASSLEEITSSMTQMSSQTSQNAENAVQANQLASEVKSAAEKGDIQIQSMVSAMGEINESGQNISKIIKVIDEIAFQTNILALNAAVEAARAGQHGKGFAVVAEEVRNLAARSAKAASETAVLIEGSVEKTDGGMQIANQTAEAFGNIAVGINKVTDLVAEIAAASNEQSQGIEQISEGLSQIDQVTQQNTAAAEEIAAAAEELSGQSGQMQHMISRFKLSESNQRVRTAPHATDHTSWALPAGEQGWPSASDECQSQPQLVLDDSEFGKY